MGALAKTAVAVAVLTVLVPANALAAYPGSNGKIAFERDGQIWTMNANGTGQVQLTSAAEASTEPQWSPNGARIAYTRRTPDFLWTVRVMNADGSGDALAYGPNARSPTWSPDGSRIGFIRDSFEFPFCEIAFLDTNPDGSNVKMNYSSGPSSEYCQWLTQPEWSPRGNEAALGAEGGFSPDSYPAIAIVGAGQDYSYRQLTGDTEHAFRPTWAPDATKLVFSAVAIEDLEPVGPQRIYRINADGNGRIPLTTDYGGTAEWSPDGSKIVFSNGDLWTMNPDGTGKTPLITTAAFEQSPDWQPVITGPAITGYPRPKHALPLRFALVPAVNECTSPNRTHGPPLDSPSCAPPAPTSTNVTVGAPGTNMVGSLKVATLTGNPATAADEADVRLVFNVTDVRCTLNHPDCSQTNVPGPSDYGRVLHPRLSLRITDRYNLPAPGGRLSGTATDAIFEWVVDCAETAGTTVGSTCSSATTADAVLGGTIIEGRRANIQFGQVEVRDDFGDVFLRQGVFVP